jgi:hypothetical protein
MRKTTSERRPSRAVLERDVDFHAFNKDERVAAAACGVSVQTMRRLRATGRGPRFHRISALCRYSLAEVFAWMDAQPCGGESAGVTAPFCLREDGEVQR